MKCSQEGMHPPKHSPPFAPRAPWRRVATQHRVLVPFPRLVNSEWLPRRALSILRSQFPAHGKYGSVRSGNWLVSRFSPPTTNDATTSALFLSLFRFSTFSPLHLAFILSLSFTSSTPPSAIAFFPLHSFRQTRGELAEKFVASSTN